MKEIFQKTDRGQKILKKKTNELVVGE